MITLICLLLFIIGIVAYGKLQKHREQREDAEGFEHSADSLLTQMHAPAIRGPLSRA
jgi:hypothetical protein